MGFSGFALRMPSEAVGKPAAPMARLTQAEVLRCYLAGERGFRGADLRGRSSLACVAACHWCGGWGREAASWKELETLSRRSEWLQGGENLF
jgi:hypothetical protein